MKGRRGRAAVESVKILDAASRVFSHKGYFQSTIDDVMAEAGVGKGTVYRHFRDKEGLLLAVIRQVATDLHMRLDTCPVNPKDKPAVLTCIARETLRFFSEHPELLRIFIREGALSIASIRRAMKPVILTLTTRIAAALGGAKHQRDAMVFQGMIFSVLRWKLGFNDEPFDSRTEADYLTGIFLHGVGGRRA